MSHKYDTTSRADAGNNAHEKSIVSPSSSPVWPRWHTPVSFFVFATMVVSGLLCVTAATGAVFLLMEGIVRGDAASKDAATQWAVVAGISVLLGWGASIAGLAFLIWQDRASRKGEVENE